MKRPREAFVFSQIPSVSCWQQPDRENNVKCDVMLKVKLATLTFNLPSSYA